MGQALRAACSIRLTNEFNAFCAEGIRVRRWPVSLSEQAPWVLADVPEVERSQACRTS